MHLQIKIELPRSTHDYMTCPNLSQCY